MLPDKLSLQVTKLNQKQLKELKGLVTLLIKPTESSAPELLYSELSNAIKMKSYEKTIPYMIAKKSYQKQLKVAAKFIEDFLENQYNVKTPVIRQKAFWLFGQLTARWLEDCSIPITISSMLNNYQKFPGLLDKAFPDYGIQNILRFIFGKEQK